MYRAVDGFVELPPTRAEYVTVTKDGRTRGFRVVSMRTTQRASGDGDVLCSARHGSLHYICGDLFQGFA